MKILFRFVGFQMFFLVLFSTAQAIPVEIVSGEIFIGGTAYQTPGYQTYLRFYLDGKSRLPQRDYIMSGEQINGVYLNHPIAPTGDYDYKVGMPFHGSALRINDETFSPVWYADCVWKIKSSAQTPEVTANSPQFIYVYAPFTMGGSSNFYGAYSTGFRVKGHGTAELKFEKIDTKYFVREARYTFTDKNSLNQSKQ